MVPSVTLLALRTKPSVIVGSYLAVVLVSPVKFFTSAAPY